MHSGIVLDTMLKMRLQRYGRKNDPSYRVVVTDSRNGPRTGNHVDVLGSYSPKVGKFQIDGEKAKLWISKGTQVSDTVYNFLVTQKIIEGKKKNALPKKTPVVNEAKLKAEAEAKIVLEAKEKAEQETKEKAKQEAEQASHVEVSATDETPAEVVSEVVEETPAETTVTEEEKVV